ncbi:MAG TPA: PEP/pyruvate-binding domain-containing protein [Candidatus Paceibacterota bacterium]
MAFTAKFDILNKKDTDIAGGKGASLGEMIQAGIPIPDGFVLLSSAFDYFLQETDLVQEIEAILATVDHEVIHTVEFASEKIRDLIENTEIPEEISKEVITGFNILGSKFLAVRSSATAEDGSENAWAGQLESFLNTDKENLLNNVRKCWASLFTPRAIFYRFEKGMRGSKISVAVIIQKMVQSEVSGVAFSVHPVTEDRNQLIIEAGLGLGEVVVSGSITPDSYVVEKEPRKIINKNIQENKQCLTDDRILELSELVLKIEKHFGFPCDIEWAYENGKFSILQSRPITTLKKDLFNGVEMVSRWSRLASRHEAQLKILGRTKIWEKELGIGYKTVVQNSLGESYVDKKSHIKIVEILENKSIKDAEVYIKKMNDLGDKLTKEIRSDSFKDFTEEFSAMMAYFFIIKVIFETRYAESSLEEQKIIEKWRNNSKLFNALDLYYQIYPEKDVVIQKGWSWVYEDGFLNLKNKIISFSKKNKRKVEFEEGRSKTMRIIKGNSAYKGIVRGKVRLILLEKDKALMQEGEIIVAPMTTVDFFPIMKKAIAFVTNEGGITSHAAIVARELKKPCIIGTKIATEVLKTGMFIEVDADNGVVRIL